MPKMTQTQRRAYDDAWRKERNRIKRFAKTLEKRGFQLAPDFIPDLHPKRRTKAALEKIKSFRGKEYYSKAAYPTDKGYITGYRSKAAYEEAKKKIKREQEFKAVRPKKLADKTLVVTDRDAVVDQQTGEVLDGLYYDYEDQKIVDIESGDKYDGFVSQNGMLIDTSTGEVVEFDVPYADTLQNLKDDLNLAFQSIRDTLNETDWAGKDDYLRQHRKRNFDLAGMVDRIQAAINEKIASISTIKEGARYYVYLQENIGKINEAIVMAANDSDGRKAIENLNKAFAMIMRESPREFDAEDLISYGLEEYDE